MTQNMTRLTIRSIWYSVPSRYKSKSEAMIYWRWHRPQSIGHWIIKLYSSSREYFTGYWLYDSWRSGSDQRLALMKKRRFISLLVYVFSNISTFKVKKIIVTWGTTWMISKRQLFARTERDRCICQLYTREEISPETGKKRRLLNKIWREHTREDEQKTPYDKEESAYTIDFIDIDTTFD